MMLFIRREYDTQERELHVRDDLVVEGAAPRATRRRPDQRASTARSIQAVNFGRTMSRDVRAVFVTEDPEVGDALRERWERQLPGVPLVIVESPYRARHRADPRLPRRARPGLAAGQGGTDHDRRPAGVRGPPLVGAAALQPDREAARSRAPRSRRTRSSPTSRTVARPVAGGDAARAAGPTASSRRSRGGIVAVHARCIDTAPFHRVGARPQRRSERRADRPARQRARRQDARPS